MDYSKTVNLPETDFPMRANLPTRELEYQKFWEDNKIYEKSLEKASNGKFILHDGPPYSNGKIHIGHALNKVLKDIINRYKILNGMRVDYYPGWDNHGLPIENKVSENFAKKKIVPTKLEMRTACREYAAEWVNIQREDFKRLGIFAHWDNPYLTMSKEYEATIIKVFGDLVEKGFIYRGQKPIHWCINDATALAEAEIEYAEHKSHSIFVKFPLLEDKKGILKSDKDVYTIIWTTTPWTIPANMAVAVHPDNEYALVDTDDGIYVLAADLCEKAFETVGITDYRIIKKVTGSELEGIKFKHPIYDRESPVVLADYVTLEDGTGVVHTAPGHGKEDYQTGVKYDIDILNPVNESGYYTSEAPHFEGLHVLRQGNTAVLEKLEELGFLLCSSSISHSYPHCWRCSKPLIFRTTTQWFMSLDHNGLREEILKSLEEVAFFPKEAKNRLTAMMANSPDWCLSRQRSWGVGIPVFFCKKCDNPVLDKNLIDNVYKDALKNGSDSWYDKEAKYFIPEDYKCPKCSGNEFYKETDVLDVWFDSGASCHAVLDNFDNISFPADMYLEGSDQHRGWFNKSLIIGTATENASPFKELVSHGFVLDEHGKAMSKSKGNTIAPQDIIKNMGADVLRLYIASCDYSDDIKVGQEMLTRTSESYRRIRNTFRFMLGTLFDFDYEKNSVPYEEMTDIDKYALHSLTELVEEVTKAYENYEFHRVFRPIQNFCAIEMSALYLDILKDRLYVSGKDWKIRRSAQTTISIILNVLVKLIAPIMPHTAEEVWQFMKEKKEESVFLSNFPKVNHEFINEDLADKWSKILEIRNMAMAKLEEAKTAGIVSKPMEAKLKITVNPEMKKILSDAGDELESYFIVSQIELLDGDETSIVAEKADGEKCTRCWLILPSVGSDNDHPELCKRCADAVKES